MNELRGVKVVRVDSVGILNGVLVRAGLVSEVSMVFYVTNPKHFSPDYPIGDGDTLRLTNAARWVMLQ